jgi:NitT/TauT family transport system substrate-binding protein
MPHRRSVIRSLLAALGASTVYHPLAAPAQAKRLVKVRYNEVVRSVMYVPAYVALSKGYFKDAGLDVELTTGNAGDKTMAALLSGSADIALIGPETAIYVLNSDSSTKVRIFCGLTSTDGFLLVGRSKVDKFDWNMLRGKDLLGFRPGSTPLLFFEEALRVNGINPDTDVRLHNNVAFAARVGSWIAGQNDFGIFNEPDDSQLELDGKGYVVASIGAAVGPADYTSFMATDTYINGNSAVIQGWTDAMYRGQKWTATASAADIVQVIAPFFPGVDAKALMAASARYQTLKLWKTTPAIEPKAMDRFQDILIHGRVLDAAKRVKFHDLVRTEYADKAI